MAAPYQGHISGLPAATVVDSDDEIEINDKSDDGRSVRATIAQIVSSWPSGTAAAPGAKFDDDADTGLFRQAANALGIAAGGVLSALFKTATTAVNWLAFTPSASGDPLLITAEGSDANINVQVVPKGTGQFIAPDGSVTLPGLRFDGDNNTGVRLKAGNQGALNAAGNDVAVWLWTSGAIVNRIQLEGSTTGNAVPLVPQGDDTNITLRIDGKGNGGLEFGTAASDKMGFHGSTGVAQQTVTGSAAGNAALASLLTALANLGLIVDSSS